MNSLGHDSGFTRFIPTLFQGLAIALPLLLVGAKPADAAQSATVATCPSSRHALDERLTKKADEGIVPLARFVTRTRMIYQLNVPEAVDRVEHYRQALSACVVASNETE